MAYAKKKTTKKKSTKAFKPCSKGPHPAKCKRAGKCLGKK